MYNQRSFDEEIDMTSSVFELSPQDLTNLGEDLAVALFRELLFAEGSRVGVGRGQIIVPQNTKANDGGIDALVNDAKPNVEDFIPRGTSGFQIKASGLTKMACVRELHVQKDINKPLKPAIDEILKNGGTYILVLYADLTSTEVQPREKAIRDELVRLHYAPNIRIYVLSQIAGTIERYPALVAQIKRVGQQCLPYNAWAAKPYIRTPINFALDEQREGILQDIRTQLRNPGGECTVFRITGLPGIGKTRLVYEVLSPEDLRSRTIYVFADIFRGSTLYHSLQTDDNLSAIIVIDECDIKQHRDFVDAFSGHGDRLSIITLSYENSQVPLPTKKYHLGPLSNQLIEKMLREEETSLPSEVIQRLSAFADGYPRIAILLAKSYLSSNETQRDFIDISDDELMLRLIGGADTQSEYFQRTLRVMMWLSLFEKVGFEGDPAKEYEWLAGKARVSTDEFKEIASTQRVRGIVQGKHYIYVTPFMLRVYLLRKWWDSQGFTPESFNEFTTSIPEAFKASLIQRFIDSVPYIATSEKGKEFVTEILGQNGLFSDGQLLETKLGANFFLKLTEADPTTALASLKRTIAKWPKKKLLNFKIGRREIIESLERIAVWKELFDEGARLLLLLGEQENERYSNNASGVFIDLFSNGPGSVAPTEASPEERFPILCEALESSSPEKRSLALRAIDKALESSNFSRIMGPESQGLKKEAKLWRPKTNKEIIDAYARVWRYLNDKLAKLSVEERQSAVKIILENVRGLTRVLPLSEMIVEDIKILLKKKYVNKKLVIDVIESMLHYDRKILPEELVKKWEDLRDSIVGNDFHSMLERYVGMDLLEDKYNDDGQRVDKSEPIVEKLAIDALADPKLLLNGSEWLFTQEAKNGYRFGYKLGLADKQFKLLPNLAALQARMNDRKDAGDYFFGGYLKALFERDPKKWELLLDDFSSNKKMVNLVPVLTWRSGISDRAAQRILDLANNGVIRAIDFRVFAFGSVISGLSEGIFIKWIEFLLESKDDIAISVALDLYMFFYDRKESKYKLPKEITIRLLTHKTLFKKTDRHSRQQMDEFHWTEIGKKFLELYPKDAIKLVDVIFEHFGEEGSIIEDFHSEAEEVIDKITNTFPNEVWEVVTKYLGPPIDARAFHIKEWLRGSEHSHAGTEGALSFFTPQIVWRWVDANIEKRAWYVASFCPNLLFKDEHRICWAREVLVRYGKRKDVKQTLGANFYTEGFTGPGSSHYTIKRERLIEFRKSETNATVILWIDEMITSLDKQIEHETIEEERRGF